MTTTTIRWRPLLTTLALAGTLTATDPAAVAGQSQTLTMLPALDSYDWTTWLIGTWEGHLEDDTGRKVRQIQSFEYDVARRYLLTRIRQEVAPGQWYEGTGLFRYDPATGDAIGEWFGIVGDRNIGLARRDGERMVWDIQRSGRPRVERVRERTGPDSYVVTNTSFDAEGRPRVSREIMRRATTATSAAPASPGGARGSAAGSSGPSPEPADAHGPRAAATWRMPPEYRALQLESMAAQQAFLHAMLDSMPEVWYGTRDNEGQRTFAGHAYHAAVSIAQAVDRTLPGPEYAAPDESAATAGRAPLRAAIDDAFAYMTAILRAQSDEVRAQPLPFAGRTIPTWQFWDELEEHTFWTLGEMVGNFRSHGMAPPAFRFF